MSLLINLMCSIWTKISRLYCEIQD